MKLGTCAVAEVVLYRVEIEGRGGDSAHNEYFENRDDAIFASAIDGKENQPHPEIVLRLSDGTYIRRPESIHLSPAPTKEQIAELINKLPMGLRVFVLAQRTK